MENFLLPGIVFPHKFLSFFSDFTVLVYGILSFIFLAAFALLLPVAYKKIRRKFPLKVNCWFCNNNTTVPYELCNGWDCPYCKQYNGFNKDGDYNKVIPEQYNYKLNEGVFSTLRTSVENKEGRTETNGFCKLCNINQQLKIQQLALFVPINENNYFEEIEQYREKLEKAYQLCLKCEKTLQETLEKQEYNLLQNRLNTHNRSLQTSTRVIKLEGDNNLLNLIKKKGALGLKVIHIIFSILLFLALIVHFETENHFLNLTLPGIAILEPLLPVFKVLLQYIHIVYSIKKELSFAGLVCCFLGHREKNVKNSHSILLAWGIFHISLWSSFTGMHIVLSGVCLLLNIQSAQKKLIELNKKSLPKKSGFQPVKKIFPDFYNSFQGETNPINGTPPLLKSDSFTSLNEDADWLENKKNVKEATEKLKNMTNSGDKKIKTRHKEDEIESVIPNEDKERTEITSNSSLNSSLINKSFASSLETEKNSGDSNVPFTEVYNNFNSLQLGGKQKKSNKPPNFLFANHNYSDPKTSSSIIKPAKFIKNLNSSSWTESNECNSRSSTPSSGYSSQKPEKIEPNRYYFPKTMTPISVNAFSRHSPNHCFDYCDGNHGFYNTMNCLSPGFLPFQQFPSPMGHTTIYTCTRPTNFSFPFSPWQGFPGQKFSPSSPRFSDSSDCDNLFQESSKRFEKDQRWFKLKTVFYYFSIFLNFFTILGLVYFTSAGIINVDWKLPKFNFFV